jgi:hypothetical protein
MINRLFNLDAYDLIPAGLVVILIGSFSFPAYNQLTYDANLSYVENTKETFKENKEQFNDYWYNNGQSFNSIEFNEYNIFPNMVGNPGGEGVSGSALNSYDCQNIFSSMTKSDVSIETGNPKKINSFNEGTEFSVQYNEDDFVCSYTYIDKGEVKYTKNKKTHVIKYNTKNGNVELIENGYEF